MTSPDYSYFQLNCPNCAETRGYINLHTLNLAVDLTHAQLRSVAGGGYHGRVKQLVICPVCDAYALMQEWVWSVPIYSSRDDCVVTVHDYANLDVSSLLSFGDVDFTPSALAGALEVHRCLMETHPSHEAKTLPALDRSLLKVAGFADTSFAQEEWDQRLDQLLASLNDSCKRAELDAAVRIILCQKPDNLPWKIIAPVLSDGGQTK